MKYTEDFDDWFEDFKRKYFIDEISNLKDINVYEITKQAWEAGRKNLIRDTDKIPD